MDSSRALAHKIDTDGTEVGLVLNDLKSTIRQEAKKWFCVERSVGFFLAGRPTD